MKFSDEIENTYKWVRKFVQTIKDWVVRKEDKNIFNILKKSENNFSSIAKLLRHLILTSIFTLLVRFNFTL